AFIDLPVNIQLAQMLEADAAVEENNETASAEDDHAENPDDTSNDGANTQAGEKNGTEEVDDLEKLEEKNEFLVHDPIGVLAKCAGYEDGEAWWNDLIEQNADNDLELFSMVEA